jgi:hypothetical protein
MPTVTILPAATYPPGTRSFGPATVPQNLSHYLLTFDKTSWTDPSITMEVTLDLSLDGGVTWNTPATDVVPFPVGFTAEGGGTDKFGNPYTEVTRDGGIPQPGTTDRRVRGSMTIAGGSITTSATLNVG